jgi:hypothetical protein
VITRAQLLALGFSDAAIRQRLANGRLHVLWRGVYAVGRPEVSRLGWWMAAVLACGEGAALSHQTAGALWGICPERLDVIEVSIPTDTPRRRRGIFVHRTRRLDARANTESR